MAKSHAWRAQAAGGAWFGLQAYMRMPGLALGGCAGLRKMVGPAPTLESEPMRPTFAPVWDDGTLQFLRQVFHWVRCGDAPALAPVLAARLPPNLRNEQGDSLLLLASYHGHVEVVRLLLQAGADTELANDRGQTALGAAAFRGDLDLVRLLLQSGARVDSPPGGRTALMIAAMFNRVEIMQLLKEQGADPAARDTTGLDPLQAARTMGADDAARLLQRWQAG